MDKTGTLTEAKITLAGPTSIGRPNSERVLELARLNAASKTGIRSPLDDAILAGSGGVSAQVARIADCRSISSAACLRCWCSDGDERCLLIVKGASGIHCRASPPPSRSTGNPGRSMPSRARSSTASRMATPARLSAACHRHQTDSARRQAAVCIADEAGPDASIGFCRFADPPKSDAREAIKNLASLGVTVKLDLGRSRRRRHPCRAGRRTADAAHHDGKRDCRPRPTARLRRGSATSICSRASIPTKRTHHCARSAIAAMWSDSSATASTTRRRCRPPMSAYRSTARPGGAGRRRHDPAGARSRGRRPTASRKAGGPSPTS